MQIAVVTSELGEKSGGLSYSCMNFSNMLIEMGHKVIIISSIDDSILLSNYCFETIGCDVTIIGGGYKPKLHNHLFFRAHVQNVCSRIADKIVDYIVAFGAGYNGLFAAELSRLTNVRLVSMLRGSEINLSISDFDLRQANYHSLKQSSAVVALSKELLERSRTISWNAQTTYKVIPNIIAKPSILDLCVGSKNEIILGCGAYHLNEKKGIANLIEMLSLLNQMSDKKFRFEFIGKIDEDLFLRYKELCNKLNVINCIAFMDVLSREQFIERMKSWDFYVQGSFCEGFSNSVSDYLSLGKAFVLTNTGFIAETINEQCPEIIFDNFIPEKMAKTIMTLVANKQIGGIYEKAYNLIGKLTSKETVISLFSKIFKAKTVSDTTIKYLNNNIISVLLHDISPDKYSNNDTPLLALKDFVEQITNNGYCLCSAKQYFETNERSNLVICTFDDAYDGVLKYALPILKQYGFTATVFVCCDYIGKINSWNLKDTHKRNHLNIDELKQLQKEGWEIGSHGKTHNSLLRLSEVDLEKELIDSKYFLSKTFGKVESYAYPYGDFNDYCKNKVSETYRYESVLK
ncbi:MAG: polysaccharide deacetylase family protein [Prevotellaceae bacterium]|jgi:peptidoglycan/xylan/chitin deacetylase (PgdA/CDA1 family)/glycosyltransferase involved in cell wall biosynthesis|nr:polysaccharide deacetylase family protein [Prevotellaceae bacterium]